MTGGHDAHRTGFTVRCACGNAFNTDDAHVGRSVRCRCGRTVPIVRAPNEQVRASHARTPHAQTSRARTSHARTPHARRSLRERVALTGPAVRDLLRNSVLVMGSARPVRRWTGRLVWLYLVAVALAWAMLTFLSERFLPATLLAYGPRFLLLAPLALLLPAALLAARGALLPLAVATLVVLGPIMGGRVSLRTIGRPLPAAPAPGHLRVLSFNTFGGQLFAERLDEALALRPDLIALQECGGALRERLAALPGWHFHLYHNLCTLSRWPIVGLDSMPRRDFARVANEGAGGSGLVIRHHIASPHGPLVFVNLHLATARDGLEGLAGGDGLIPDDLDELRRLREGTSPGGASATGRLELNTIIRERESERAAAWAVRGDPDVPVLVAGDFNLPVESTIYRAYWRGFRNAFEETGTGFGWSKGEGKLLRIRIDHVLGNATAPRPAGTWLGPDWGSDHRPVIADLRW